MAQVGGGSISPTTTYSYDRLYRLLGDGTNTYTYDPVGNRLSWGATSYTYDRADRITAAGSTTYAVNANGNLTGRGADVFAYDQANRLKSATVGGTASTYTFDGDGKRASSTVGSTTTSFVYDVSGKLPMVLTDGTRKYVYGVGLVYETDMAGNVQGVSHADGLGSVRALTDGSGNLIQTYKTDPFGVPTATQGTSTQPFGFTGEQADPTGFVYLRARMYDPQTGRFLQRDSVAKSSVGISGLNRYAYAADNPVTFADPSGRCLGPVVVICIFGVADWVLGGGALAAGTSLLMFQHHSSEAVATNISAIASDRQSANTSGASAADAGSFGDPNQKNNGAGPNDSAVVLGTEDSWGRAETLGDHFARHGADFGATSADEYAAQASRFLQRAQAERLPTKIDSHGVIRAYDPDTNTLGPTTQTVQLGRFSGLIQCRTATLPTSIIGKLNREQLHGHHDEHRKHLPSVRVRRSLPAAMAQQFSVRRDLPFLRHSLWIRRCGWGRSRRPHCHIRLVARAVESNGHVLVLRISAAT